MNYPTLANGRIAHERPNQKEYETHRNHLMEIRDAELDKELLAAFRKSGLSHQDAIDLIKNSRSDDGEESDES